MFYLASLEKEPQDLSTSVLATGLLVVHDAIGRGEDKVAKLPTGQYVGTPLLNVFYSDIVAWGNHGALVDTAEKLDHNLATAMVIDDVELADVAMFLHTQQEFHNDAAGRPDQHLPLALFLGVDNGLETIGQHAHTNHLAL